MFWDLQKTLAFNIYKTIDLYEFVHLCQFIDQIFRDMNTKLRNIKREYEESILRSNINNQESSREQSNVSNSRFRSETFKSNSNNQKLNNREMSQVFEFDQVNAVICYNCDKVDYIARVCRVSRKINLNNFVKKIEKNIVDQEIESRKD
jgi:hypothetical protein